MLTKKHLTRLADSTKTCCQLKINRVSQQMALQQKLIKILFGTNSFGPTTFWTNMFWTNIFLLNIFLTIIFWTQIFLPKIFVNQIFLTNIYFYQHLSWPYCLAQTPLIITYYCIFSLYNGHWRCCQSTAWTATDCNRPGNSEKCFWEPYFSVKNFSAKFGIIFSLKCISFVGKHCWLWGFFCRYKRKLQIFIYNSRGKHSSGIYFIKANN